MSATYPVRKTVPVRKAAAKAKPRPRLVVISSNRQVVARGPFVALVGALMLGGLLSLLMLHTLAAQDAFRQTSLQAKLSSLTDTEQQLEQQVQTDSAPAVLEQRAKALGMVPSTITSYHRHANGRTYANEVPLTQVLTTTTTTASTAGTTTASTAGTTTAGNANAAGTTPATGSTSTTTATKPTTAGHHKTATAAPTSKHHAGRPGQ